ncbi:hypothetical protein AX17_006428 [Amanita inopinata Kibby_2008]|nr:hypothetical protein AX17_006428 [Amanita inopinata Kibby_2008]
MAGEIVLAVTYGIKTLPKHDPYIELVEKAVRPGLIAAVPGTYLVDVLPILKYVPEWMPGAGFKRDAREWHGLAMNMLNEPYRVAKESIDTGSFMPSFVSKSLLDMKEGTITPLQEDIIKTAAGTMYAAGVDTFSKKARAEIDAVVPYGELPTFEDEDKLPYIKAICLESLRWRVVAPIGIPHMLAEDDVYKCYRLPKGSVIVPNIWAMLHREDLYPEPLEFKPERFMKDGRIDKSVKDPFHAVWGFGRRICPGRSLAFSSLWITIASLIAAFDISKAVDTSGNVIEPEQEFIPGLVWWSSFVDFNSIPKSYKCSIKVRSKEYEDAVNATEHEEFGQYS